MALPVTDGFVQTSGTTQTLTTYSAAWSILEGGFSVGSGNNAVHGTGATYNTARHNVETFDVAQFSQVVLTAGLIAAGEFGGPAVACQAGENSSYHVEANGTNIYLSKCVAGVQSTLQGPVAVSLAGGATLRLERTLVTSPAPAVRLRVLTSPAADPTNFTERFVFDDTAANRITAAGQGGIFKYGDEGTARITNFEAGNLSAGAASEVSGDAVIDEPTAAGGAASAADVSGNATIDEPTAGGGLESRAELSGDAAEEGPTAGGGFATSNIGTLTSGDLKDNTGAVHSNAPFEARVYSVADASLVLRKTGLTSTTSATAPKCSFQEAPVVQGTQYYVHWIRTDTGQFGIELLTAT